MLEDDVSSTAPNARGVLKLLSLIAAPVAVVVSIAALVVNLNLSQQALQISQRSLAQSQQAYKAAIGALDLDTNMYWSKVATSNPPDKATLQIQFGLENVGTASVRGCATYYQYTNRDGKPLLYYPTIIEDGSTWKVDSGDNHETDTTLDFSSENGIGEKAYITLWFECESPHLVTAGTVMGVDLLHGKLMSGSTYGLNFVQPMSIGVRESDINKLYGYKVQPGPTPTRFVVLPNG